jgi:hypothetical protein
MLIEADGFGNHPFESLLAYLLSFDLCAHFMMGIVMEVIKIAIPAII